MTRAKALVDAYAISIEDIKTTAKTLIEQQSQECSEAAGRPHADAGHCIRSHGGRIYRNRSTNAPISFVALARAG
jgi:hypothetical protein